MKLRCINLGSGQRRLENDDQCEWINVDCVSRPGQVPDLLGDPSEKPLPLDDRSLDVVLLCHNLEHYTWGPAMNSVVDECYRLLKSGGRLIIVVPDQRALAQRWLLGLIDDYIYNVNTHGAWQGERGDLHAWSFDQRSLSIYLNNWKWAKSGPFDFEPIGTNQVPSDWWMCSFCGVKP